MGRYIIRRVLWLLFVILLITFFTFVIFFKMTPDPVAQFAGKQPTPKLKAEIREQLGLDKPFWQQYGSFLDRTFTGDEYGWPGLGFSYDTRRAVKTGALRAHVGDHSARAWRSDRLAVDGHPDRDHFGPQTKNPGRSISHGVRLVWGVRTRFLLRVGAFIYLLENARYIARYRLRAVF